MPLIIHILKKLWKNVDFDRVRREALSLPEPVEWKFIVERAPWQGGIWERMIRSMKTALRATLCRAFVSLDTLRATVIAVEGQLNSRPLTALSSDPNDLAPITPAHLLFGRALNQLPDHVTSDDTRDKIAIRWKHRQALQTHFWNRWRKEYLSSLMSAQKWHK